MVVVCGGEESDVVQVEGTRVVSENTTEEARRCGAFGRSEGAYA